MYIYIQLYLVHDIATAFILPDDWQIAGNKRVLIVKRGGVKERRRYDHDVTPVCTGYKANLPAVNWKRLEIGQESS